MSLHSSFRFARTAASLALISGASLCLISCGSLVTSAKPLVQPSAAAPAASNIRFPEISSSYLRTGAFIGPDHVRRITPGLSKDQVRMELGNPQFGEGLFGVNEWDYTFNFYTNRGNEYVTCQYKLIFKSVNDNVRVSDIYWNGPACESYLYPAAPPAPVIALAPPPAPPRAPPQAAPGRVTLGADGLFRFGKSSLNDLLPEGRSRLDTMAAQLARGITVDSITITGYTDRIGSAESNMVLSQARAATVRDYLVSKGVASRLVRTSGLGASNPVKECAGGNRVTPELVACLQPNRRVDIDIVGQR